MNDLQVHVIHSDRLTIADDWNVRDVCSTYWRLYINNRDGAAIWWREGRYGLAAHRIHLVPAYVKFSCQNVCSVQHLYVHFDVLGLSPRLQQQSFDRPISLPMTPASRKLLALYSAGQFAQQSPISLCLTHAVILESLAGAIELVSPARQELLQSFLATPNPLRPAMQLIEQRLPLPVPLDQLAKACGLSVDHFIRRFRRLMGQTPGRYVLQRRTSLAARALLYSTDPIERVALEHGFANRFHFTRSFKSQMGITPAAYRIAKRV